MSRLTRQSETVLQFLENYRQLWTNGSECSLTYNAKNGKGWANLSVCLGLAEDSNTPSAENSAQQSQSRNGPSQQRRRARRAAARAKRSAVGTENQGEILTDPSNVKVPVKEASLSYAAVLSGEDKTKSCSLGRNHSEAGHMEVSGNSSGNCQSADKYDTAGSPTNKEALVNGEPEKGRKIDSCAMETHSDPGHPQASTK